ncbi:hypothetical protein JX265_012165 [Neoarthrinium moseri]|uniref:Fucose-specific lectin n=1 Tax=Neoarthrinium moseri TaxID=1658444 RepID=A0A9P9WAX5_9PEZI|nr:hypothetical protein JX266_010616 [Neoarthrinium moseri]KAI1855720.1 hypothetical protein JX265_012165 [Neoarthrinium moseri]
MAFPTGIVLLVVVCLLFGLTSAGFMSAWSPNGKGPQLILQDGISGKIFYSLCNNYDSDTPIFPNSESAAFAIDPNLAPKKGTAVAGVGWWADPNTQTGLMLVVLGEKAGYRLYYHDKDRATAALKFDPDTSAWSYLGIVSNDHIEGNAIGGGFVDADNITVVTPRDKQNIEISSRHGNGTWDIATFPHPLSPIVTHRDRANGTVTLSCPNNGTNQTEFTLDENVNDTWTLEAYDGNPGALGFTLDQDSAANLWYIGNDSQLHQIHRTAGRWRPASNQDPSIWPRADAPNAQFAAASDNSGRVWLYYVSGGNMTQVYRSSRDMWELPTVLQTVNDTAIASNAEAQNPTGLSTGAKAGIGVGVGVGGIAILGIGALTLMRARRKPRATELHMTHPPSALASPAPDYSEVGTGGRWIGGQWVPDEGMSKEQQEPVHELPHEERSHEMLGEGHARELGNSRL